MENRLEGETRLDGRVVLVTGGGRGLGRAIALRAADLGAKVAVAGRDPHTLEQTVDLVEQGGGAALACPGDVGQAAHVDHWVTAVGDRFGRLDGLVNNAAGIGPPRFFEDATPERFEATVRANLLGPQQLIHAALGLLGSEGGGAVVNLTSGLGRMAFPRFCAYGVSKAGLDQLTRMLAEELREQSIRVNSVDPGVMDTDMQAEVRSQGAERLGESLYRRFLDLQRTGQLRDPASVAPLVVWLLSEAAVSLTGQRGSLADYTELGWPG
jgi:NAD(P)-dependent dehydrogenase (short-subunit alcohol dehydrogenase family)